MPTGNTTMSWLPAACGLWALALGCGTDAPANPSSDTIGAPESDTPGGDSTGSADAPPAAEVDDDTDPHCHYDCFDQATCRSGVVTRFLGGPIPCWAWRGQCGSHRVACPEGEVCLTAYRSGYLEDERDLCTPPSDVGAPCQPGGLCPPPPATVAEDGAVTVTYLACDQATNTCVAADPPAVPDYMQPCDTGLDLPSELPGTTWVLPTNGCSGNRCLVARDSDHDCARSGCTLACFEDHDCPQGSLCVHPSDLDPIVVYAGDQPRICVPGGAALALDDLTCTPTAP